MRRAPSPALRAALVVVLWSAAASEGAAIRFTEEASASGLDFVHFNGMTGERLFMEMAGGGVALFDADGDGDLDVYVTQGRLLDDSKTFTDAVFPPRHPLPLSDRLYRNDSTAGDGAAALRFVDVTISSGIAEVGRGYGMGVAAGDVDGDGFVDLYLANFGDNVLLHNRGDGTFEDWTARAGVGDPRWSSGAAFFDLDRDGDLDLYVLNYVAATVANHKVCFTVAGEPDYCGPLAYAAEPDRLFRNRGDGTFEDVSRNALRGARPGSGLGAVSADFDGDGWLDLYVANDLMPNSLWLNQGDGSFVDDAAFAGCATNGDGQLEASMGVVAGDVDGDGDEDLFMTHLTSQTNTLYLNDGSAVFNDRTDERGLGVPSWQATGFGAVLVDLDLDGWLDLATVNGAIKSLEEQSRNGEPFPLRQVNQLFRNQGGGRFAEVTSEGGAALSLSEVSRGLAAGDLDLDGDQDLVVVNNGGPLRLLRNGTDGGGSLALELREGGRDALGAAAWLVGDGPGGIRRLRTDGSYASAQAPELLVALTGPAGSSADLELRWPGGRRTLLRGVVAGRRLVIDRRREP